MTRAVLAIARMTILELRRSRVLVGLAVLTVITVLFALALPGVREVPDSDEALAALLLRGLGLLTSIATLLTLLVCAPLVADEVGRGTVLVLATRPPPRTAIVLGKYAGAAFCVMVLLLGLGVAVGVLGALATGSGAFVGHAVVRALGAVPALLLAAAVATAMSTVVGARMAGLLSMGIWAGSRIAGLAADRSDLFEWITWVVPSPVLARFAAGLVEMPGLRTPPLPEAGELLAALLAIAGWIALAAVLFERRHDLVAN
jgi:ABC-type transport system involved in multi-copper enzyme maturation permease subunit